MRASNRRRSSRALGNGGRFQDGGGVRRSNRHSRRRDLFSIGSGETGPRTTARETDSTGPERTWEAPADARTERHKTSKPQSSFSSGEGSSTEDKKWNPSGPLRRNYLPAAETSVHHRRDGARFHPRIQSQTTLRGGTRGCLYRDAHHVTPGKQKEGHPRHRQRAQQLRRSRRRQSRLFMTLPRFQRRS